MRAVGNPAAGPLAHATCPVCGIGDLDPFLLLADVPVLTTEFHDHRESALAVARGDLDLAVCHTCALVWNRAFDPALVDYTPDYENSQHFSPAFQDYVEDLARRLDADYSLRGARVVDIGCGKGEFLAVLARAVDARGIGFDPTFDGEVDDDRIKVVRRFYDQETAGEVDAELVMARHVLEHLADPVGFLQDVREASGADTAFYYEVPNAEYVFSDDGMWDLIYQHVGYFGRPSLDLSLRASGHRVVRLEPAFHDQFLGIDATGADDTDDTPPTASSVEPLVERVETFGARHRARLDRWNNDLAASGGEIALWGAGAKGVAFLNLLEDPDVVTHVVDVNPRKADRFVPGTGHRVSMPSDLSERRLQRVLVMNPAYENEIRRELARLGIEVETSIV